MCVLGAVLLVAFAPATRAEELPVADPLRNMACAMLGSGFHALPGTDTCVRTGGRVRVDSAYASGDFDLPSNATSNARGTVKLETRTQTDFGLVRTYLELNADIGPDDD
jgi:hypothetical protein